MTPRLSLELLILVALIVVHSGIRGGAQENEPKPELEAPRFDATQLSKQIVEHLEALDKAVVAETTQGALGLQLHLFADARTYDLMVRLRDDLRLSSDPSGLVETLAQDREFLKQLRRMDGKAGFRLDLIHPEKKDEIIRTRQIVHMFHGQLARSFSLRLGSQGIEWGPWREPRGLESTTVRIARHWTIENHRRVAKTSAMKPLHARAVMRMNEASIWGFFPRHVLEKKKGFVRIVIPSFDQFTGHYTDEHIVDLNEAAHILERELTMEASRQLPLFFPEPPEQLGEYLGWVEKELAAAD